ncbi:hypothetical protein H6P81_003278 [Aristolochia fimbriata]|uniref:DEAD-box ATP-dependent RNA helicase 39 n=1 Tax=Aristolochia fimbriata TaxID=158543 RepID=A0AAV7FF36_ARIFI|nr:hypothetical protein H6P81_003278 [Aristolochia fimbriata]
MGGGTGRALLALSFSSTLFSRSLLCKSRGYPLVNVSSFGHFRSFRTRCLSTATTAVETETQLEPPRHSMLLEKLRLRHLKDAAKSPPQNKIKTEGAVDKENGENAKRKNSKKTASGFEELGLTEEVMGAVDEMAITVPTEIQCIGIPTILDGRSVVLGSHTGSGKTLAYMLPLVQLLRRDETLSGMVMKPRRPRAVVLCPTRELCEQVFRVAKSISHHARFRSTMVSGGGRLRPQEDSLNAPIDMVVGTPGRVLQHIEEGNMVYGDIRYLVLDEADTMFDHGFGPDIRKFVGPLKNRASKPDDPGFQTVLVSATMTKAVQKLVDEEFQGISHIRTSTLHKKIASARHDFIKLSGAENKLEALLQVLEPSLAKGNRVMVFCNTLNSSRAVDHFLSENQISTVNYHGEVPAEQRVENLKKFKSDDGDCPTLVCTDLAARGLDLDVDHVIMFDFPSNSIDYLHRTGRTARMGAKGKVTSLVAKKDSMLATRIEEAIKKNESLESLSTDSVRREVAKARQGEYPKGKSMSLVKASKPKRKGKTASANSSRSNVIVAGKEKSASDKRGRSPLTTKPKKSVTLAKPVKFSSRSGPRTRVERKTSGVVKSSSPSSPRSRGEKKKSGVVKTSGSKLSVVGFRGRSSSTKRAT